MHAAHQPLARRKSVIAIIRQRERTHPAIEDLYDIRSSLHLLAAVFREHDHDFIQQTAPSQRISIHQLLCLDVIPRSAALNHVAGQCVRRAAEADDSQPVAEMPSHFLNCGSHILKLTGAIGTQRAHIFGCPDRFVNHRSLTGLKFKVQTHRLQRQKQIGKDNCRIYAELFGCGNCHLGGQLRLFANLHQCVVLPHLAVLRHVAASLAQKPHRRAVHGLSQAGSHKAAAGQQRVSVRDDIRFRIAVSVVCMVHPVSILPGLTKPSKSQLYICRAIAHFVCIGVPHPA